MRVKIMPDHYDIIIPGAGRSIAFVEATDIKSMT